MTYCQQEEFRAGRPAPRTCPTCKLGPCQKSAPTSAAGIESIGDRFAHRLAIMLECALLDPTGVWNDAHALLDEYRQAHESVCPSPPTFMGEPVIHPSATAGAAQAVIPDGWRTIETVPKDGSRFLAWRKHGTAPLLLRWDADYDAAENEWGEHVYHLTHWRPIPAAPDDTPTSAEGAAKRKPFDVEKMIAACVPGGSICDPQMVADEIRRYCTEVLGIGDKGGNDGL